MAGSVAIARYQKLEKKLERQQKSMKRSREAAAAPVRTIIHGVETISTAFGFGYANGYYNGVEILGAPVDLLSGFGFHLLGFVMDDDLSPHLHAVGNGALSSFAVTFGQGAGDEARQRSLTGARAEEEEAEEAAELEPELP